MSRFQIRISLISIFMCVTQILGCTSGSLGQAPASPGQAQPINDTSKESRGQAQSAISSSSEIGQKKFHSAGARSIGRISIDRKVMDARSQPFVRHAGTGKFESYLALNIAFKPVQELRSQIEINLEIALKHRGEAHITVVTPPEFERLSSHVSIEDINDLIEDVIQLSEFQLICLGRGQRVEDGEQIATYFLVVDSKELRQLRATISKLYLDAGGSAPTFLSEYHPHITIGFTKRDLYESDGVKKDKNSCISSVIVG